MDGSVTSDERMVPFESPAHFLADLDPTTTGRVIASATDVALIIDDGIIRDVALGNEELCREGYAASWRGRPWIETVTVESRPKIEDLLQRDRSAESRWRQVNHPSAGGIDLPVRYTTVPIAPRQRILALGRDLRATARLQQRLVEAHQNLERDFSRLRRAEARYRLLFESVSQPLLIVDPANGRVEEANPATATAIGRSIQAVQGASLLDLFDERSTQRVSRAISESVTLGSATASGLETTDGDGCSLSASAFREDDGARVIVRLTKDTTGERGLAAGHALLDALEELPDGLVVVGADLRILAANRAFLEMTNLISSGQMAGGLLSDFLGRSTTDFNVLVSNLRNHGAVRNFGTVIRDRFGNEEDVEVSAVATPDHEEAAYGFSVRSVARRLRADERGSEGLPSSVDQLTGLVGRVPLREIVRQSTDFIEKLCIEAALEITDDNRASAAEMLGLSRQGLYSKLRRFGVEESR